MQLYLQDASVNAKLCEGQFYKIWKKDCKKIKITKANSDFARCDPCTKIDDMRKKAQNRVDEELAEKEYDKHFDVFMSQKQAYYERIAQAMRDPRILSIVLDIMDQKKTGSPYDKRLSKSASGKPVKQKVIGVKVHGRKNYLFTALESVRKGGNNSASVLHLVLDDLAKTSPGLPIGDGTLYVLGDNASDNKCVTLLVYLAWLVRTRRFRKIQLNFLMVGHTHEDIDRMFQLISTFIKPKAMHTFSEFEKLALQALANIGCPTEVRHLPCQFDVDAWFEEHKDPHLACFKNFHEFVFEFDEAQNDAVMQYKLWNGDEGYVHPPGQPEAGKVTGPPCV